MKRMGLLTLFCLMSGISSAQIWGSDLETALKTASVQNKNVLLFFSVADACDACRRLDRSVFQSEEFAQYANENLVLVKMDFQNPANSNSKAENLLIVEKYNKDGFFPWVVLVDKTGKILGKADIYDSQSPSQYVRQIKNLDKS